MGSMKKMVGAAAVGAVALLAFASPAVADAPPPSPGACIFSVTPASSTTFAVTGATVSGTAPVGVTATLYLDGVAQGVAQGSPQVVGVGGTFTFTNVTVATSSTAITVNYTYGNKNAYTTICTDVLNDVTIRIKAEAATLAFTGSSSNTPTYVLVGIAAVVLGLVMVVGVRRRASVRG